LGYELLLNGNNTFKVEVKREFGDYGTIKNNIKKKISNFTKFEKHK
jgi:hypothetical protein